MSTVDELKYNFDVGARANRFDCRFFLPNMFNKVTKGISEVDADKSTRTVTTMTQEAKAIGIRCESASLPGRSVDTKSWSELGAERQMPTGTVNDGGTIDFTFLCDQSFADRLIIEAWLSLIYSGSPTRNHMDDRPDALKDVNINDTYKNKSFYANQEFPHLNWYDDYKSTIQVIQHRIDRKDSEDTKRNALEYTLVDAYPISFQSQDLSMAGEADIMKFSCTFAYRYWESKYVPAPKRSFLNKGRVLLDALLDGSNLLSRFGKEGKVRKTLNNLDTRTSQISNIFGGG